MPSALVEVTPVTAGTVVSITSALFAPSEFAVPGFANVKVASFDAASLIDPEFNASELVPA